MCFQNPATSLRSLRSLSRLAHVRPLIQRGIVHCIYLGKWGRKEGGWRVETGWQGTTCSATEDCLDNLRHPARGKGRHLRVFLCHPPTACPYTAHPVFAEVLQCGFQLCLHFHPHFPKREGEMRTGQFSEGGALRLGRTWGAMTLNSLIH